MNYQHAFHAGNFADVHKHIVLTRVLDYLRQKPAAFRVVDTHAGAGRYDLFGPQAARSGEWRDGIARLFAMPRSGAAGTDAAQALIAPYLDIVAALNPGGPLRLYPGSPLIVKALLRRQDRLIACELEPSAAASLGGSTRRCPRQGARHGRLDGAFCQHPAKRTPRPGCDRPTLRGEHGFRAPFPDLAQAHRKWANGVYLFGIRSKRVRRLTRWPGGCAVWQCPKSCAAIDNHVATRRRRAGRLRADYRQSALPLAARIAGGSSRTHAAARADGRLPPRLALERMSLSRLFSLARVDQRQGFVLI